MNTTIATSRAKQIKALQHANWFYRTAAVIGPLVLVGTLFELGRNEPHAVRHVCLALLIVVVGVSKYFGLKKDISQLRALRDE